MHSLSENNKKKVKKIKLYFAGKQTFIRNMICGEISEQQKFRFFQLMFRASGLHS